MPQMRTLALTALAVLLVLGYVAAGRKLTSHQLGMQRCRGSAPAYVLTNPPLNLGPIHLKAGHATNWVLWPYEYLAHVLLGRSTTRDYIDGRDCISVPLSPVEKLHHAKSLR